MSIQRVNSLTVCGCIFSNFTCFFCLLDFFSKDTFFQNIILGITSECQAAWIQIRPQHFVVPDLGPNCLQWLSADEETCQ